MAAIRSLGAILASALILYLSNGLQGMLLPLAAEARGFSTFVIGFMGSAYAGGFVAGCLAAPFVIRRVGHIRTFGVLGAVVAITVLGYLLAAEQTMWLVLRFVSGVALSGLFMVIESWLNGASDNATRGRILSVYLVVNSGGLMLGQLGVGLASPADVTLFAVVAMGVCLATLPVGLTTAVGPAPITGVRLRLGHLYRLSPVGIAGAALIGSANGAFTALAAVFLSGRGFDPITAAGFVSAAMLGGVLAQIPFGWISDRVDRRFVVIALSLWAAGFAFALWASTGEGPVSLLIAASGLPAPAVWVGLGFLYGIAAFPAYGVVAAHMNDHVEPDGFVEASGGLLLVWGLGATAGPIAAAALMDGVAPNALFLWVAAVFVGLALYAVWRTFRRAAPATKETARNLGVIRPTPAAAALAEPAGVEEARAAA